MLTSFFMLQVMVPAGRCNWTPLVGRMGITVQSFSRWAAMWSPTSLLLSTLSCVGRGSWSHAVFLSWCPLMCNTVGQAVTGTKSRVAQMIRSMGGVRSSLPFCKSPSHDVGSMKLVVAMVSKTSCIWWKQIFNAHSSGIDQSKSQWKPTAGGISKFLRWCSTMLNKKLAKLWLSFRATDLRTIHNCKLHFKPLAHFIHALSQVFWKLSGLIHDWMFRACVHFVVFFNIFLSYQRFCRLFDIEHNPQVQTSFAWTLVFMTSESKWHILGNKMQLMIDTPLRNQKLIS